MTAGTCCFWVGSDTKGHVCGGLRANITRMEQGT